MRKLLVLFWIIGGITACRSSENSDSFSTQQKELPPYKTFAWLPKDSSQIQNILFDNQIIANRIRDLTNNELFQRGYTLERDTPDVLIQYTLMVEQKEENLTTTQVTPSISTGPNYISPYNSNAYDNPLNLYYYSNPGNIFNSGYFINNYPYYTPYGFPSSGPSVTRSITQQINYKEGTLVIDLIDRKAKQLMWRGWATDLLHEPDSFENNLSQEIPEIFKKFPSKRNKIQK